jgi:flagellar biosynthesis protein
MRRNPSDRKGPPAAVALGYDLEKDVAPRVLAAGRGELAEAILALAEQHQVPIHTDSSLADALIRLQLGASIPPELYAAVAEVLAFLWSLERRQGREEEVP